jgi:hypothetical protein
VENDLLTNKTNAALLRESELEIVQRAEPPVDLRTVPPEQWDNYLQHDVVIPPELHGFLPDGDFGLLEEYEINAVEEATENFHGVKPPYYIYMSLTLQQTGRPWAYVPEAGQYLTGLTLGKIPHSEIRISQ